MPKYLSLDPNDGTSAQKYLSLDPNEGKQQGYLSTDPNEGQPDTLSANDPNGQQVGVIDKIFQTLGRPGAVVAGGINALQKGEGIGGVLTNAKEALTPTDWTSPSTWGTWKETITGTDLVKEAGYGDGIPLPLTEKKLPAWAAGLALDIGTDPTNLVGGSILKSVGWADKVADASKAIGNVADNTKLVGSMKGALDNVFTLRPSTKGIMSNVGDISYNDFARLGDSSARAANEGAQALAEKVFAKVPLEDRQKIAHAIDRGAVETLSPDHQQIAQKFKSQMDHLFQEQINLGNLTPDQRLQNYVQYLTKSGRDVEAITAPNVSSIPQSARQRQVFQTLEQAVTHGEATDDAMEIMARSTAQVEKAKSRAEFLDGVATRFADPTGRKLNLEHLNISPTLKTRLRDVKLDPRIAQDLERSIKVWDQPTELDNIYKTGVKLWKGMATSLVPGHHMNNLMGNVHNMYVAGDMTLPQIAKAYKDFGLFGRWDDAQQAAHLARLGVNNAPDVLKAMKKYEILGTTTQLGELAEGTSKVLNRGVLGTPLRVARQMGTEYVEEPARVGLFLHELKKGKTMEQAAITVKNVLFDYAELTKSEKAIRDYGLVPFYTWMRKNIPLQIESAIKNPHKVEAIGNIYQTPWNANPMEDTVIPESRQMGGFVPTTMTAEGLPVMARFALPSLDVNKLGDSRAMIDSMGPGPKLLAELAMGQRVNGAPIHTSNTLARPSALAKVLSPLNKVLPESLEGYMTPMDVGGRDLQRDTWSWLTGAVPAGPLANPMYNMMGGSDPLAPPLDDQLKQTIMQLLGWTPDVITPNDEKFEIRDRKADMKRQMMKQIVMEK